MAFISALHQICQLISGFSSLVFCIVFYLIRSPALSCNTPQPYTQSLALVLCQQKREDEESLQETFLMLLMDGLSALGVYSNITCLEWAVSSPFTLFPPYLHLVL